METKTRIVSEGRRITWLGVWSLVWGRYQCPLWQHKRLIHTTLCFFLSNNAHRLHCGGLKRLFYSYVVSICIPRLLECVHVLHCTLGSTEQASSSSSTSLLRELCVPLVKDDMLGSTLLQELLVAALHLVSPAIHSLWPRFDPENKNLSEREREI